MEDKLSEVDISENKNGENVGIGGLLDPALERCRKTAKFWLPLVFVPFIFQWLGAVGLLFEAEAEEINPRLVLSLLSSLIGDVLSFLLIPTLILIISGRASGTFVENIKAGSKKIGAMVWTGILTGLVVLGGAVLFVVPGILVAIRMNLASTISVLEDKRGLPAMAKSWNIIYGRTGDYFLRMLVGFVFALGISATAAMVGEVLGYWSEVFKVLLYFVVNSLLVAPFMTSYVYGLYESYGKTAPEDYTEPKRLRWLLAFGILITVAGIIFAGIMLGWFMSRVIEGLPPSSVANFLHIWRGGVLSNF